MSRRFTRLATGSGLVRLQCYEGVDEARALYERGYQMVTLCSDGSLVTQGAAALLQRFQAEVPG